MYHRPRSARAIIAASLVFLVFAGPACPELIQEQLDPIEAERQEMNAENANTRYEADRKWFQKLEMEREAKKAAEAEELNARRPEPTAAYKEFAAMTPDEIRDAAPIFITMLTLDGAQFPFPADQFSKTPPDKCETEHYHAAVGYTLALAKVTEPATPCGFGNAVSIEEVEAEALIKWMHEGPKAPRR